MKEFAAEFYKSKAWQKCRESYAQSVGWLCEDCLEKGIYKPGEIVHHKTELTPENIDDPVISLNADSLETRCRACHAIAHGVKPPLAEGLAFDEYGNVVEAGLMPKPAVDDDEFY